jgi:hypothetical protein
MVLVPMWVDEDCLEPSCKKPLREEEKTSLIIEPSNIGEEQDNRVLEQDNRVLEQDNGVLEQDNGVLEQGRAHKDNRVINAVQIETMVQKMRPG